MVMFYSTRPKRLYLPLGILYKGYRFFPEGMRPGRGVDNPHHSTTDVKEKVELYIYSYNGLSGLFYDELYIHIHFKF
jgi:hypothetical protein